MGISDKFRKVFNLDDDYDEEYEEGDNEEEETEEYEEQKHRSAARQQSNFRSDNRQTYTQGTSKVVDIHTTAKLQVVLKKPEHSDEAKSIADELLDKRTVVLNLEATAKDEAGKLICFLCGVAYANRGQLKKIANDTYIITPYNVDVMGDLLDELENSGMFFV